MTKKEPSMIKIKTTVIGFSADPADLVRDITPSVQERLNVRVGQYLQRRVDELYREAFEAAFGPTPEPTSWPPKHVDPRLVKIEDVT